MRARMIVFVAVIAVGIGVAVAPGLARAQEKFPTKPIRLVVGYGPGSQPDTSARLIGQKMSEKWEQPVVIENRRAALGTLAASLVAKGIADGGAGSACLGAWMRPGSDS